MKQKTPSTSMYKLRSKYYKSSLQRNSVKLATIEKIDLNQMIIARLHAEIKNLSYKFNSIFDNSNCYYIILDTDLKVVDFNRAALKLIKKLFQKKMTNGSYLLNFFKPAASKVVDQNIKRSLNGESFVIERKINYPDKRVGWWRFEFSPATDSTGSINGIVFNAEDITRRKRNEKKIESQHQQLMEISSKQSHEIRGPVSTILGLMNLIKEENYTPDREYLMLLQSTTELLDKNIREIVTLAESDDTFKPDADL